jgi:two-component system, chemotaxis family, protein-glutamate methylesterase/glutaminase
VIRLLVVEDSKTVQQALVAAFHTDPQLRVIGTAETGEAAVAAAQSLRPDIITMDINLPGMDGFEATRAIMSSCPVPIVIVTGRLDPRDSATLFRVLAAGALMVLAKPDPVGSPGWGASTARLIHQVKLMSEIKVVRRSFPEGGEHGSRKVAPLPSPADEIRVVAIGASTGGPPLLQQILSQLPSTFNAPVLVVQHMTEGFMDNFAHWLNISSRLPVQLARHQMEISPGQVYLAPDGGHMEVQGNRLVLSGAPPENGMRPSVSALFRSVATRYGRHAAGVLLSGMGSDGAAGLKTMREHGGITIAQNRESSLIFGMPAAAIRLDAALHILPPEGIIALLAALAKGRKGQRPTP